jgi:hypothetical protein
LLEGKFEAAEQVYDKGTFSRSFAQVSFGEVGLVEEIEAHTAVTGTSDSGSDVTGMLLEHAKKGAKSARILYHNADNVGKCFVGGNPQPIVDGCKS